MVVLHKHIWKPASFGSGVCNTTLCGRVNNQTNDYNIADSDNEVTCKFCIPLLKRDRKNYNSKWIGYIPKD